MSTRRRWAVLAVALGALLEVLTALSALATNAASGASHWPGPLDLVRRHPWWSMLIILLLMIMVSAALLRHGSSDPQPASKEDVEAAVQRVRVDVAEAVATPSDLDKRIARLPPYPQILLDDADDDDMMIWRVIAPFTDENVVPVELAREWAAAPPAALKHLRAAGLLVVAELLAAYQQPDAAAEQFRAAVELGATPRAYWLVRIAQIEVARPECDRTRVDELLAEAGQLDAGYPLTIALRAIVEQKWAGAVRALEGWNPSTPGEKDMALMLHGSSLAALAHVDDAINVFDAGMAAAFSPAIRLQLARLLRVRAAQGTGDSGLADAFRAVELAIQVRNARRTWRGDSAEAAAVAADAAVFADDPNQTWMLTRTVPEGDATPFEAADPRVVDVAVMGAVLTGRFSQARELIESAPAGSYARLRMEAELVNASGPGEDNRAAIEAWRVALAAAATDEQKLEALRGLAVAGATDQAVIDNLRSGYSDAVAEIELLAQIASAAGPDADEQLRALEEQTPLATLRRAELFRPRDPEAAADLLVEANIRWRNPRLLLMAIDCYENAGQPDQAQLLLQQTLTQVGPAWSGRVIALRRLANLQLADCAWAKVVATCGVLLELDPHDQDARWMRAHAEYRAGDLEDAWRTLKRSATPLDVVTPSHARLLLDLSRRYADAAQVVDTVRTMWRAFPHDENVYLAAITAVQRRADRTQLPAGIEGELTQAVLRSFRQQFPGSDRITPITIEDSERPFGALEDHMRKEAATYSDVLAGIRTDNLPVGALDRVVGKPYSAIFPYAPLGCHRAFFPDDADNVVEASLAAQSLAGTCLIDASALYTLALLPDAAARPLVALLSRPSMTDVGLWDLIQSEDHFSLPNEATMTFDSARDQVVIVETDPAAAERQHRQAQSMLRTARPLRRINHSALVDLPWHGPSVPVWILTLDAAKHHSTALWADDFGLRLAARSLGIKTFSTRAMLTIARTRGRFDDATVNQIGQTLVRECVVDFPHDHDTLVAVAAEQGWEPRSVAVVLSRAATWANTELAYRIFLTVISRCRQETIEQWAHAALTGIFQASAPDRGIERLTEFMTAILADVAVQREHTAGVAAAVQALVPDKADEIVCAAINDMWDRLKANYAPEQSVMIFMKLICGLGDKHRQYAARLVLD
jgi:hypothetical protein